MDRLSGLVALLLCNVLGACAAAPGIRWQDAGHALSAESIPLTQPVVLLADTQIHESRGTASHFWSLAGDEFFPVTIRTGQQVIGAPDMLLEALERTRDAPLLLHLHLGDAIDVSCQSEWRLV